MSPFVPKGQEIPKPPSDYLRFEDGETKIRILADSIGGWKYQSSKDDKMVYSENQPQVPVGEVKDDKFGSSLKYFIACPVWSFKDEEVKVMEITQTSIMNAIEALENNSEWGDVTKYDLTITRGKGGNGMIKYTILGSPNKGDADPAWLAELEEKKKDEKTGHRFVCKWEEEKVETKTKAEPAKEEAVVGELPWEKERDKEDADTRDELI